MNILIRIKHKIHSFIKDSSGVAAVLGAVLLPTLVGGAGLAVDGTRYLRAKTIIIAAADQAAIAAAAVDGVDRSKVATEFFKANLPIEYKNIVDLKTFSFKDNSTAGGAVVVDYTIQATVKTLVGGVVGLDQITLDHTGRAVREITNLEVVFALPVNGTMCSTKSRTPNTNKLIPGDILLKLDPDPSCRHFNQMKTGTKNFIEALYKNATVSRLKIGLVPYNFKVRMGNPASVPPIMLQNEINVSGIINAQSDPTFFQNVDNAGELAPVLSMTSDKTRALTALNALTSSPAGVAWSRSNLPTLVAGLMFDPTQTAYFPNITAPAAFNDIFTTKILVMMTDGSNIGCCFTNWTPGDYRQQYVYFHKPDNDQTLKYCETLKKAGVKIYTIIFDVSENDPGGREVNNLFARCASGTYSEQGVNEATVGAQLVCRNKQSCYNVKTSDQLKAAYEDIAQNFTIARTSR